MDRPVKAYEVDANNAQYVEKTFRYHAPKANQTPRYEWLRAEARKLAVDILELCPLSRERSLALTKLEEAVMWANAAIARNE